MTKTMTDATFGLDEAKIAELNAVVDRAQAAAAAFRKLDQKAVDDIVLAMVVAGLDVAIDLAGVAMEETSFGVFEDKVIKNYLATEFLYDYLKDKKTVGVVDHDEEANIDYVAEPIGVVMAITPITNPTSTVLFKAIVAAKTRNAIIFRPSPHAVRSAERSAAVIREAGEKVGLPPGTIQVVPDREHEPTHYLFKHPGINFIWTTGGPTIVELANSAGKPAISVGPGNAPLYIHRTADIKGVVVDVLISKTFDASMICPAEQTAVIDDVVYDQVIAEFQRMGAHLLSTEEADRLAEFAFGCSTKVNLMALGQQAPELARRAGITVEPNTKVMLALLPSDLEQLAAHPLVQEKLMPVLGVVRSPNEQHAIDACVLVTEHGGLGHTSAIYANDDDIVQRYAHAVRTGRILVNAPTAVGALGGVYNSLPPTFSLGCGTWGGSSTTDNVNYKNLLNLKQVSRRKTPSQWFRVPSETYFNAGAIENLREMEANQVVVVTDPIMEASGIVDEIRHHLRSDNVRVFATVTPEPDEALCRLGAEMLERVRPDTIIAVGGGSVLDAAKAMRLFWEHPEVTLRELALPWLDPRKRVAEYPQTVHKARLIAMPTTSGTGSEVSPGAVITVGDRKMSLIDYTLTPDTAIVDPMLTRSLPPGSTADTGIDALTHAVEAAVSIFASPFSDAFCVQAARLIFEALPRAYANGNDIEARTSMANAATLAGLAFSNAFLGVNHALAHSVGAHFHIPHGRTNAIFLPHVMRYNASLPTKFMPAPGYSSYVAPEKYAQLGNVIFGGHTDEERRLRLFTAVEDLVISLNMPLTLKDAGVHEDEFEAAIPDLARAAFDDPSLRTNPRMPMLGEIIDLLRKGYYGA